MHYYEGLAVGSYRVEELQFMKDYSAMVENVTFTQESCYMLDISLNHMVLMNPLVMETLMHLTRI